MSTMKQTLTDIKTVLLTYQNTTLSDLRTYKRGCLPPMPSFPALAILPEKEKIIRRRSNGQQVVERDILIEVYAKAVDRKYAVAQVMDIMEVIKNIGQAQISSLWNSTCFDFDMYSETYMEPVVLKSNQVIYGGSMRFRFRDHHTIPVSSRKRKASVTETKASDILNAVYDAIYSYIDDLTYSLSDVNIFAKQDIPPLPKFPAVTVIEGKTNRLKSLTGMDDVSRIFDISVWTELVDKEYSLDKNLDIVEILKNILEIEYTFTNTTTAQAYNSQIIQTTYNRNDVRSLGRVYRSAIQLEVNGFEPLV